MENKKINQNSICGGVIPMSLYTKNSMRYMMCCVLFDEDYTEYENLRKQGKHREAKKIVNEKSANL